MKNKRGYLSIVLHSHLPFIKHPEHEFFLEENWLFEAITETYLPLYISFERLRRNGVKFQLSMSITPPLISMLTDSLLMERYQRYLDGRLSFLRNEIYENKESAREKKILQFYLNRFEELNYFFDIKLNRDILSGFKKLQEQGFLEIITCTATHTILPLELNERIREVQVEVGIDAYKRVFGHAPKGIWLGECAYTNGVEKILANNGIKFTFLDTHGVLYAEPQPLYGVHAPIYSEEGVAFFGRDPEASKQVWSAREGYPGDFNYREFYRDIGYEIPVEKVNKYLHPGGFRFDSGIKMHKITGNVPLSKKELYNRENAIRAADTHAGNFMFNIEKEAEYLLSIMDREPIIVAPFDTELFGHWWFEGPDFIESLLRKIDKYSDKIETITPFNYLKKYPTNQLSLPAPSTWGDGGYFSVWLNEKNDWVYPHLYMMGKRMIELAEKITTPNNIVERALTQMGRELLLAESSDWTFLITTGTASNYSIDRVKFHINAFNEFYEEVKNNIIDKNLLEFLEERDSIFPFLDYRIFRRKK